MLTVIVSDTWSYGPKVRDYGKVLVVKHNDEILFEEADTLEPEDVSFNRDLSWVREAILAAYAVGLREGRKE